MVIHSQGMIFETRFQYQSFMVDLDAKHCTCRLWDLSGIPCVHAIAAINYIHKTPEGYIHPYFLKDTFLSCYETNIKPVNGSNMWEETPFLKPLPPVVRRMPGRPKTKRKKHRSEQTTKFSTSRVSVARTVRCHHCKQFGHNRRGCKNEAVPTKVPTPKKMGRPKKCPTDEVNGAPAEENGAPAQEENEAPSQQQSQPSGSTFRRTKMKAKRPRDTRKKQKLAARRGGGSNSRGRVLIDEVMNDGDEPEGEVNEGVDIVQKLVRELIDDLDVYEPLDVHQVFGNYEAGNVDDVFVNVEHVNVADEPVNVADDPVFVNVNANAQPVNVSDVHQGGPTARALREALNDVEDGINEILADIDEDDTETVIEPDFSEGDDGGVVPDKHQLNEEDVAVLLEAGYTMAELEGNPQLQMPVDETAPAVMVINS
jgi:hypothetical protein